METNILSDNRGLIFPAIVDPGPVFKPVAAAELHGSD